MKNGYGNEERDLISLEVTLENSSCNIFKRLWAAFKYIFNRDYYLARIDMNQKNIECLFDKTK